MYPQRLRQKGPLKDLAAPIESFDYVISEDDLPCRVDSFIKKKLPWRSRAFFQRMIDDGLVTLNEALAPGRICAGRLPPQKAAVLLRLALTVTDRASDLKRIFSL